MLLQYLYGVAGGLLFIAIQFYYKRVFLPYFRKRSGNALEDFPAFKVTHAEFIAQATSNTNKVILFTKEDGNCHLRYVNKTGEPSHIWMSPAELLEQSRGRYQAFVLELSTVFETNAIFSSEKSIYMAAKVLERYMEATYNPTKKTATAIIRNIEGNDHE